MDPQLRHVLSWPSAQVRLDLDGRCNLRCAFCRQASQDVSPDGAFPLEHLEKTLESLGKDVWSVYLSCTGEPLLHPGFAEAMKLVRRHLRNCDVQIVTNATLLDEAHAQALLAGNLSRVTFSVDSVRQERYESIRRNARWEIVRTNIVRFLKMRGERPWPKVMINTILMEENQDELEDIAKFCVENGVDAFRVQHLQEFEDVPSMHRPVADTPELRHRLLHIQWRLLAKGVVFDHPLAMRWEKIASMLLSLRLHRFPLGYLKYLAGGAWGALFSRCRMVGWECFAFPDGTIRSCSEPRGDQPWDPRQESLVHYLRQSRRRSREKGFDGCAQCRFRLR